jgi:hypothetical protein
MARFASGKNAYAISDRSGQRYLYKDMKREWNGLLVGPDEYEQKHPQLGPFKKVDDPQALKDARPEPNLTQERAIQHGFSPVGFADISGLSPANLLAPVCSVGTVTFSVTPTPNITLSADVGNFTLTGQDVTITSSVTVLPLGAGTFTLTGQDLSLDAFEVLTVTVQNSGYGDKFFLDGSETPTLNLYEGSTYRFDQSDSSNSGHPIRFSTTSDGTHGGGSEYTTGVTTNGTPGNAGAYTQIVVASSAPTLYYYCTIHSGLGGQANTP